ncbi:hypothetical protein [Hymenobacter persicinus]|uniref:Uncharacterized protein n=1 Tax=Hymenobacter persicinus TaxID=2025506 RepID=A0A4Q5LGB0_9BACT|nr:hypothetical protein [Hymenobacter persicinus]RYU82856.1 hypothetical protein EWM57_03975 [Hymenobacter persicinus]
MTVELIPVIEVGYHNQSLPAPTNFPTWKYPAEWDEYTALSHAKAGFPAPLVPFVPGLGFYRAIDIELGNLAKLTVDHLQGYFDGTWALEDTCAFFGGYVLRLDGQNVLFPQCCGQLNDIIYWKHIAKYGRAAYYQGHPAPSVTFTPDEVVFDCREKDEGFQPETLPEIRVSRPALFEAYDKAVQELSVFAHRLQQVQQNQQLAVGDIANLLIYQNGEFPDEQP